MPAPAGKADYPGPGDVLALLAATGVEVSPVADLATAAAAGARDFERAVSRTMLAPPESTRRLNAPVSREGALIFDRDLASLTSVAIQAQGGTSQELTQGTDYTLEPFNAAADGMPYTALVFFSWGWSWYEPLWYGYRGSIYVTGRWGYGTTIPEDAWAAMQARAALLLWGPLVTGRAGGPGGLASATLRAESGGLNSSENYGDLLKVAALWQEQYHSAVCRYRRFVF